MKEEGRIRMRKGTEGEGGEKGREEGERGEEGGGIRILSSPPAIYNPPSKKTEPELQVRGSVQI